MFWPELIQSIKYNNKAKGYCKNESKSEFHSLGDCLSPYRHFNNGNTNPTFFSASALGYPFGISIYISSFKTA